MHYYAPTVSKLHLRWHVGMEMPEVFKYLKLKCAESTDIVCVCIYINMYIHVYV